MRKLSRNEFEDGLSELGLRRGDVVHVQSDLRRIGPVESEPNREGMLRFYLEAFRNVIGEEGTLTTFTASLSCGRTGAPFILETTPSEVGVFSEFIRTNQLSIRSVHPLVSIAGIGPRAAEICGGAHFEGYSGDSPWARLIQANGRMVTLGLDAAHGGTSFFHFIETTYGVPYKYTKLLSSPVFVRGKKVEAVFTISVRYLDFGIKNTPVRLKSRMLQRGYAKQCRIGNGETWSCTFRDAMEAGFSALSEDRYFLLEEPPKFRNGVLPFDGPSGEMQLRVDRFGTVNSVATSTREFLTP